MSDLTKNKFSVRELKNIDLSFELGLEGVLSGFLFFNKTGSKSFSTKLYFFKYFFSLFLRKIVTKRKSQLDIEEMAPFGGFNLKKPDIQGELLNP